MHERCGHAKANPEEGLQDGEGAVHMMYKKGLRRSGC